MEWPILIRRVSGHSMMPVLPPGTYVLGKRRVNKLSLGDIVIFVHQGKEKIKRVNELRNSEMFVLGDHPEASTDSRQFGWVQQSSVLAKVFWPHAPKNRAENQASPDK